eukprot:Sspe_Gene.36392::Locus_17587_Transcript_1_1_Confidence_1.000_Length_1851::g.36392::m.36392/K04885/KCNB1; potassium voltage-gated channel Shab-related subfamily B member 1
MTLEGANPLDHGIPLEDLQQKQGRAGSCHLHRHGGYQNGPMSPLEDDSEIELCNSNQRPADGSAADNRSLWTEGSSETAEHHQLPLTAQNLAMAVAMAGLSNSDTLSLAVFRALWRQALPHQSEEVARRECSKLFTEIDIDHSDTVEYDELINFLGRAEEREMMSKKTVDPKLWREKMWYLFGFGQVAMKRRTHRYASLVIRLITQAAIIISIAVLMIDSLPSLQEEGRETEGTTVTNIIETCCVAIFTFEFVCWCISYPSVEEGRTCKGFFTESATWVDLLSILPFYLRISHILPHSRSSAFVSVRIIRFLIRSFRVIRVLKLGRKSSTLGLLGQAITRSAPYLWWLNLMILMAMSVSSSFLFYAEREEAFFDHKLEKWVRRNDSSYVDRGQPTAFQSVPDTMWWAVVTLTTVGYGDKVPITPIGKVIGGVTMLTGLLLMGFPVTILTGSFQELLVEHQASIQLDSNCLEFKRGLIQFMTKMHELKYSTKALLTSPTRKTQQGSFDDEALARIEGHLCGFFSMCETRFRGMESRLQRLEGMSESILRQLSRVHIIDNNENTPYGDWVAPSDSGRASCSSEKHV